jgi:hypothetical protein
MYLISYALIFGIKDQPYDLVAIVHVLIGGRDGQVSPAC